MKRILTVLVLLVAVAAVAQASTAAVAEPGQNSTMRQGRRTAAGGSDGTVVGQLYGPAGDPDGMGSGNGAVPPIVLIANNHVLAGPTAAPGAPVCVGGSECATCAQLRLLLAAMVLLAGL